MESFENSYQFADSYMGLSAESGSSSRRAKFLIIKTEENCQAEEIGEMRLARSLTLLGLTLLGRW